MNEVKTIYEAMDIASQLIEKTKEYDCSVTIHITIDKLEDIEKLVKQEKGTMCYADGFVSYHFGQVKIGRVEMVLRDHETFELFKRR